MNSLTTENNITMSSLDFLNKIINPARAELGQPAVENRHFLSRVEDEIDDLGVAENFYVTTEQGASRAVKGYTLNIEQMTLIGMRESKAVRRSVLNTLKTMQKPQLPGDYLSALKALTAEVEQRQQLENQLALAAPKVEFADRVGESEGILIGNYAKVVQLGQNRLFAWLRDNGVLIASGSRRNVPKQEYMDRGYFTVKETAVNTNHGIHISFTTKITGKGQQWLTRKLVDCGMLKAVGDAA